MCPVCVQVHTPAIHLGKVSLRGLETDRVFKRSRWEIPLELGGGRGGAWVLELGGGRGGAWVLELGGSRVHGAVG